MKLAFYGKLAHLILRFQRMFFLKAIQVKSQVVGVVKIFFYYYIKSNHLAINVEVTNEREKEPIATKNKIYAF